MEKDNQPFVNKAKDTLEELADKTKKIFGDVNNRGETRLEQHSQSDQDVTGWTDTDRKHAAGEFEYQTRNQYQNGVQLDAVPNQESDGGQNDTTEWASRYEEQQPVSDFTEMGAVGGETAVEDTGVCSRSDYGTEAVYGDPTGRYNGNEANLLSEEERQARYDEQEPLDDFLDESDGPGQRRL